MILSWQRIVETACGDSTLKRRWSFMKTTLILSLLFCLSAVAAPPQPQVKAFTITKGSIAFDSGGVTFHTGNQDQHFPFSKPLTSGSSIPLIPGLRISRFEDKTMVSATGSAPKDVSQLTLVGEDGNSIDLIAGHPVEVYRVDITFSDQRNLALWTLASEASTLPQTHYVTISGDDVRAPGRIIWTPDLTLMSALSAAGGFSDNPNVYIIRGTERTRVRLKPIMRRQAPDPVLQPGDQIEVGQVAF
jgi:hypothetical protein